VVLEIESVATKRVPVRVDVVGEPPSGYRIASVSVEPTKVRLEGARKIVRQLREVVTDRVDVSRLRETTVQEVPLSLGVAYVWRAGEERGKPVRVEVRVERLPGAGGEF
jgi:YbbR domain-containing protein